MALDIAARYVLMPVLLAQGAYLRRTARLLPEPAGARQGVTGDGPPLRMLIIGDSSALGVGVTTQDDALLGQMVRRLTHKFRVDYTLVAMSGARTCDVLKWLDDLPQGPFDLVITALGVNDVTKAVTLRQFRRRQIALVAGLKARLADPFVIVSGLPPVHQFPLLPPLLKWILGRQARRFDRRLDDVAAAHPRCAIARPTIGLGVHNMAADGFHPGPEVYAAWADTIIAVLARKTDLIDPPPASA